MRTAIYQNAVVNAAVGARNKWELGSSRSSTTTETVYARELVGSKNQWIARQEVGVLEFLALSIALFLRHDIFSIGRCISGIAMQSRQLFNGRRAMQFILGMRIIFSNCASSIN